MINLKRCIKCGELFDIDTSKDLCPECRKYKEPKIDEVSWK